MRRIFILPLLVILLVSSVSAEIIINQQPETLYNLGDVITFPVKIVATKDVKTSFNLDLVCDGIENQVYKSDIKLATGNEKSLELTVILDKERIGNSSESCKLKASLDDIFSLTNNFTISDKININMITKAEEISPGQNLIFEGNAKKENGDLVKGFVEVKMVTTGSTEDISLMDTVNEGYFKVNLSAPKNLKAGQYLIAINVYEKESEEEISNNGFINYNALVIQVPTSLEIIFETSEVEPGTNLKVKTILHDQSGEKMPSNSVISIKDETNLIHEQIEIATDKFLEYPIAYNEPPNKWTVFALSNQLTSESNFNIKEKQEIEVKLINKTLEITNKGNVPYNKSVVIKIGDTPVYLATSLGIDDTTEYLLTAPDGEYTIEVLSENGNKISGRAMLTGNAIDVQEIKKGIVTVARQPLAWVFIVAVLGFMIFMFAKKGFKRSFLGNIIRKSEGSSQRPKEYSKKGLIDTSSRGFLSLSIKGKQQDASVVCLKIKNFTDVKTQKEGIEETLQKIKNASEAGKAIVYENNENIFFMLVPSETKTLKNEGPALDLAIKLTEIIKSHNKIFRQPINFGISINSGAIVGEQEGRELKFMSMGTLITGAKKIATLSDEEILISESIKEKLMTSVKAEKHERENIVFYTIKKVQSKQDEEENKQFIKSFVSRLGKK
ncbi:MAG: hypothetical protein AABX88_01055 [Nanoarchaeota archaeon]